MIKRIFILILLAATTASISFAQNKNEISQEIKKMDRQWQVESYSSRDLKDYDRIVADDFLITGSNGKTITKAEKRANVAADYTEPASVAADSVSKLTMPAIKFVRSKNVAISNGYIIEKYVYKGNKIDSRVYFTCTYLRRDGRWQVVAAQYTRINQK